MNPKSTSVPKLTIVDIAVAEEHGRDARVNDCPKRPGRPGSTTQTPGLASAAMRPHHKNAMALARTGQPHTCMGTNCMTYRRGEVVTTR